MTQSPAPDPGAVLHDATAAMRRGDVRAASALAMDAAARFRGRADADGQMRAENLLGAVAFETGAVAEAETRFGAALDLAHGLEDSLMTARASNNLASVAHLTGRPAAALSLYRTALLCYQRLGDRRGVAETSHNLGIAFRQLGRRDGAERASDEAVRHAEAAGDPALLGLVLIGRAELHLDAGAWALAERAIERAAALAQEGADPVGVAEAGRLRALHRLGVGDVAGARREAEAARERARDLGSVLLEAESTAVAARAAHASGHAPEADKLRVEAEALFRRLGATALIERLARDWDA